MPRKPDRCRYWAPIADATPEASLYNAWWGNEMAIQEHDVFVTSSDDESSDIVGDTRVPQTCPTVCLESFETYPTPGRIIVRDDYTITLDYVTKIWANGINGIVVTGQPGIGKTFFLWYLLRYRLGKMLPTMFQLGAAAPLFFHESGVYRDGKQEKSVGALGNEASIVVGDKDGKPRAVWSLIDMLDEPRGPSHSVWAGNVFPVQTVSSYEDSKFRAWTKQKSATSWIMNPWTRLELVSGLALRHPECAPVDHARLQGYYDRYGPVPRVVFEAYLHGVDFTDAHDNKVDGIIQNLDFMELWRLSCSFSSPISEHIVCQRRVSSTFDDDHDDGGPPTTYSSVLSRVVMYKLVTVSKLSTVEEKRKICEALAGIDPECPSRRWCFASYAHIYLSSKPLALAHVKAALHPLEPLAPVLNRPTHYSRSRNTSLRGPGRNFTLAQCTTHVYDSISELATSGGPQKDRYYIPSGSAYSNPGFDSFLISGNTAYIFQTAVSKEHQIDTEDSKGLRALKFILQPERFPSIKWHYVLVVPKNHATATAKLDTGTVLTAVGPEWVQAVGAFSLMVLDMEMPLDARRF